MQIGMVILTWVLVGFMWTVWYWVSDSLAARGVPGPVLSIGALLFGIWTFGTITKLGIFVSMPSKIRFVPTSIRDVANASSDELQSRSPIPDPSHTTRSILPLDAFTLESQTREMQSLGFEPVMDFKLEGNRPLPPAFARLFFHREHNCSAELHQIFPQTLGAAPLPVMCSMGSGLGGNEGQRWTLETSNSAKHGGSGVGWAMRRPCNLWSRHAGWTPTQVLAHHLAVRNDMARELKLIVEDGQSWERYCECGEQAHDERRRRLLKKTGVVILFENFFCRNKTEWWGNWTSSQQPSNV